MPEMDLSKHKTVGVSLHPELRGRAGARAAALGLPFSRYVALCVEAELQGRTSALPAPAGAGGEAPAPRAARPRLAPAEAPPDALDLDDALARGGDYAGMKAASIQFEADIQEILAGAGLTFQRHRRMGPFFVDFAVDLPATAEAPARTLAVECRFNLRERYQLTLGQVLITQSLPGIDAVVLVVPYLRHFEPAWLGAFQSRGLRLASPDTLLAELR